MAVPKVWLSWGGPARALESPLARLSFIPKLRAERLGVFIPAV